jgi:octaprenyl-diphosphate synthase
MQAIFDIVRPVKRHLDLFEKEYQELVSDLIIPDGGYFRTQKGKHLRPLLFFLAQGLVGRPDAGSVPLSVLIELLHTASLLHDDVVDGSNLRRGRRSYPARQGNRTSVLAGDYLVARALAIGVAFGRYDVIRVVSRTLVSMTRGELVQNRFAASRNPAFSTYYQIIQEKTASLFATACDLAALVQKARPKERERLQQLGNAFGMAFQIRDDVLDFTGKPERLGKPTGLDIRNGQRTLPFLLALETVPSKQKEKLLAELSHPTARQARWIIRFVRERDGIALAEAEADAWMQIARGFLSCFAPNAYRRSLEKLFTRDGQRTG